MRPVLTPAEMGEADRRTIAAGIPVDVLMERAGRAVAWTVRREMGGTYGRHAVVVCGKGNNGGDGLVTARALREWGVRVDVFTLDAGVDRQLCERALLRADAFVDAMFGTGFRGALDGDAAWVADAVDAVLGPCVAVDIPSGVNGLTGAVDGEAVHASHTVTFSALTALVMSIGVSPTDCSACRSRSTMICRCLPPNGIGSVAPGNWVSTWRTR